MLTNFLTNVILCYKFEIKHFKFWAKREWINLVFFSYANWRKKMYNLNLVWNVTAMILWLFSYIFHVFSQCFAYTYYVLHWNCARSKKLKTNERNPFGTTFSRSHGPTFFVSNKYASVKKKKKEIFKKKKHAIAYECVHAVTVCARFGGRICLLGGGSGIRSRPIVVVFVVLVVVVL